jgi:hypothetical protein
MAPVVFTPGGAFTSEAAGITALGITDPGITGITDPASTLAGVSMFAVADIMDAAASTPAEAFTGIAPPIAAEAVFTLVEP